MARPVCVLLVLLACAAGLSACGGDDGVGKANAYVAQVNAAQDRFLRSAQAVQDDVATATSTPGQTRQALDAFSVAVRRAVGELRQITPPGSVSALHARLIAALASYEPVIAERRAVAGSGDGRTLITARTRFSTESEAVTVRIQQAIERINAKLTK